MSKTCCLVGPEYIYKIGMVKYRMKSILRDFLADGYDKFILCSNGIFFDICFDSMNEFNTEESANISYCKYNTTDYQSAIDKSDFIICYNSPIHPSQFTQDVVNHALSKRKRVLSLFTKFEYFIIEYFSPLYRNKKVDK